MMTSTFITFVAALSMLGGAAPLAAKVEPVSATVKIADLDLATGEGLAALERRFVGAIKLACGHAESKSRASVRAADQCRDNLHARASLAIADIARQPERFANSKTLNVHG